MKKLFRILAIVATFALTGCDKQPPDTPLAKTVEKVYDIGTVDLPGTAYKVHGYRITRSMANSHFLYFLEDAQGALVSGIQANEPFTANRREVVDVVVTDTSRVAAPRAAPKQVEMNVRLSCASVEECQKKLALLNQKN